MGREREREQREQREADIKRDRHERLIMNFSHALVSNGRFPASKY